MTQSLYTSAPMTKNCIAPWKMFGLFPDGRIYPCCGSPDGDFGNILNSPESSGYRDVFGNESYHTLRSQLLTGKLQKACQECRVVPDGKIPVESLRHMVVFHLQRQGKILSNSTDLSKEYAFETCTTNITDKCNFSCIYCFTHSNDKPGDGMKEYCELNFDMFLHLIAPLVKSGLKTLAFCGSGELTTYPLWKELCTELFNRYPNLFVSLVSNFGKRFSDAELDVLTRFSEISISCDTLDPKLYPWLRYGGRIEVLLDNIARLKSKLEGAPNSKPRLIINITESTAIVDTLTDLARYAADNEMSICFSNLIIVPGSQADQTGCIRKITDLSGNELLHAWEVLCDLPERMTAQNPHINNVMPNGPLFEIIQKKAESISYNRFIPTPDELFYKSFADAHPKNPAAFLKKIFRSFDECHRGILLQRGTSIDILLPHASGLLTYRLIWLREQSSDCSVTSVAEIAVGRHLLFEAVGSSEFYTHVLFEVLAYSQNETIAERLSFKEPEHAAVPISVDKLAAQTQNDLGILYIQHGDVRRARRHFESAVQLQPEEVVYKKNLADALAADFQLEESLKLYLELQAKSPHNIEILKKIADICLHSNMPAQARYFLELVITIQPCDAGALESLSNLENEPL